MFFLLPLFLSNYFLWVPPPLSFLHPLVAFFSCLTSFFNPYFPLSFHFFPSFLCVLIPPFIPFIWLPSLFLHFFHPWLHPTLFFFLPYIRSRYSFPFFLLFCFPSCLDSFIYLIIFPFLFLLLFLHQFILSSFHQSLLLSCLTSFSHPLSYLSLFVPSFPSPFFPLCLGSFPIFPFFLDLHPSFSFLLSCLTSFFHPSFFVPSFLFLFFPSCLDSFLPSLFSPNSFPRFVSVVSEHRMSCWMFVGVIWSYQRLHSCLKYTVRKPEVYELVAKRIGLDGSDSIHIYTVDLEFYLLLVFLAFYLCVTYFTNWKKSHSSWRDTPIQRFFI